MTQSRMSLADILKKEFKKPEIRKKCRDSSQKFLDSDDSGMSTRVFNDFPRLMTFKEFNAVQNEFSTIFKRVNSTQTMDEKEHMAIAVWGKDIARRGCSALFNGHGFLQSDFLELLGWETHLHAYSNSHLINILSSYIATVIEQIMSSLSELMITDVVTYTAICKSINDNYSEWSKKAIQLQKKDFNREQAIQFSTWLIENYENFTTPDISHLQKLIQTEFMWESDSILTRNEKLGFWLEILFQIALHKKSSLLRIMWDYFSHIFDKHQIDNYLEVHQIRQYRLFQSLLLHSEKEQKPLNKLTVSESKDDLSQIMTEKFNECITFRTKNNMKQYESSSTLFLLTSLTDNILEDRFVVNRSDEKTISEEKKVTEFKKIITIEEDDDESIPTFVGYTVGLLSAGAKGLLLFAKTTIGIKDNIPGIELTSHPEMSSLNS